MIQIQYQGEVIPNRQGIQHWRFVRLRKQLLWIGTPQLILLMATIDWI